MKENCDFTVKGWRAVVAAIGFFSCFILGAMMVLGFTINTVIETVRFINWLGQ